MKKSDLYAILGYAALLLLAIFLLGFLFKAILWITSSVLLGFAIAAVMCFIQWIRSKEVDHWFIVRWGTILSVALILVDLIKGAIAWFGTLFWIVLVAAIIIWAVTKKKAGSHSQFLLKSKLVLRFSGD